MCDYFRGVHSTGLAAITHAGVNIHKKAVDPITFLDLKSVDDDITSTRQGFIGHNRHATMGAKTAANAHPFTHGDITLAHNGTLTNKAALEKKFLSKGTFSTDSELVCFLFDNFDIPEIVKAVEGAFAFVWWNDKEQTLNFVRNDERPFNVYHTDKRVYFASEAKMLHWLLDRNDLLQYRTQIFEPEVGQWYKFKYDTKLRKMTCSVRQLEVAEKKPYTYHGGNLGGRNNSTYNYHQNSANANRKSFRTPPPDEVKDRSSKNALITNNQLSAYNKKNNLKLKFGDTLFMWLSRVVPRTASKSTPDVKKCDLEFTLAGDPYTTVKVYDTVFDKEHHNLNTANPCACNFKTSLSGIATCNNEIILIGGSPLNKSPVKVLPVLSEELEAEMNQFSDMLLDAVPPIEEEASNVIVLSDKSKAKEETPAKKSEQGESLDRLNESFVHGFNDALIPAAQFKHDCDQGCCMCGDSIDFSTEFLDRHCEYIQHDRLQCRDCAELGAYGELYTSYNDNQPLELH